MSLVVQVAPACLPQRVFRKKKAAPAALNLFPSRPRGAPCMMLQRVPLRTVRPAALLGGQPSSWFRQPLSLCSSRCASPCFSAATSHPQQRLVLPNSLMCVQPSEDSPRDSAVRLSIVAQWAQPPWVVICLIAAGGLGKLCWTRFGPSRSIMSFRDRPATSRTLLFIACGALSSPGPSPMTSPPIGGQVVPCRGEQKSSSVRS